MWRDLETETPDREGKQVKPGSRQRYCVATTAGSPASGSDNTCIRLEEWSNAGPRTSPAPREGGRTPWPQNRGYEHGGHFAVRIYPLSVCASSEKSLNL